MSSIASSVYHSSGGRKFIGLQINDLHAYNVILTHGHSMHRRYVLPIGYMKKAFRLNILYKATPRKRSRSATKFHPWLAPSAFHHHSSARAPISPSLTGKKAKIVSPSHRAEEEYVVVYSARLKGGPQVAWIWDENFVCSCQHKGKNATFQQNFTQPGNSLLVQSCKGSMYRIVFCKHTKTRNLHAHGKQILWPTILWSWVQTQIIFWSVFLLRVWKHRRSPETDDPLKISPTALPFLWLSGVPDTLPLPLSTHRDMGEKSGWSGFIAKSL